ncbi:MAG: acylase, partial [Candidatus Marinimicrobia bacterium]|nr:acylase [Candidatus Neomarinimicrobiota bacterium]
MTSRTKYLYLVLIVSIVFSNCSSTYRRIESEDDYNYDVTIYRDTWGVPHIFGITDADVAYGLAWAHSEDDFKTIQDILLAERGKLASVYGKSAAVNDYYVAFSSIWDHVNNGYYQKVPPDVRAICEAYANGVNKYASMHPNEVISDIYPIMGKDIIAGFLHRTPLMFGIDNTIKNLMKKKNNDLSLLNDTELENFPWNIDMVASNVVAVNPNRSEDGFTRLMINTHQPWSGPTSWYEVHLHSEEGWNMVGGLFPGSPVALIGHNENLGWSHTVNSPDLIDVYALDINPENDNEYYFDGEWKPLIKTIVPIKVKIWGPISWTFKRDLYHSVHGPVIKAEQGSFALKWAKMDELNILTEWYRMNKATNLDEFKTAMSSCSIPMFNTGYADKSGNIFYVYNGAIPDRKVTYDWESILPGNTSQNLWTDYLLFNDLPQTTNPPNGYFQNGNSSPFLATGELTDVSSNITVASGVETYQTNRALRMLETFGTDSSISKKEFYQYKFDLTYSEKSLISEVRDRFVNDYLKKNSQNLDGINIIKNWNLKVDANNTNAALAIMTFKLRFNKDRYKYNYDKILKRMNMSIERLMTHYGKLNVPLGDVQRLERGNISYPLSGGPDIVRAIYSKWEKNKLIAFSGDCYFQMVEWDREGNVSAESITSFGTATQDSFSKHYNDQSLLFSKEEMKPVWMELDDILKN